MIVPIIILPSWMLFDMSMTNRHFRLILLIGVWAAGCGYQNGSAVRPVPPPKVTPAPVIRPSRPFSDPGSVRQSLHVGEPLTDSECDALAQEIVRAIYDDQIDRTEQFIDVDAQLEIAMYGMAQTDADRAIMDVFRKPYLEAARKNSPFQSLSQIVQSGGSVTYLHSRRDGNLVEAVFRVITADEGLNYCLLTLARRPDGVRMIDLFVALTGDYQSNSTRRTVLLALANNDEHFLRRVAPTEFGVAHDVALFRELGSDFMEERFQAFLEKYDRLSDRLKSDNTLLAFRIHAALRVSPELYLKAIEDAQRMKPNDPSLDLLCLNGWVTQKKFAEAHACLDRLDKRVGPDAYLKSIHAGLYIQEDKLPEAQKTAEEALEGEPSLVAAVFRLVEISLKRRDFTETARLLTRLKSEFGITVENLMTHEAYTEFVKSDEFKVWSGAEAAKSNGEKKESAPTK